MSFVFLEIPMFLGLVRARVTFQNVNKEEIDPVIFEIPGY